ncbi:MAG: hypothetical protein ACPL3P_00780 [Anaerolineales bacterium]
MLARILEESGIPTVLITNMPYWAERIGVPRTLAVEHPFGCPIGFPDDEQGQLNLLRTALSLFETSTLPGEVKEFYDQWPEPIDTALQSWQPLEPSPIIRMLTPRIRDLIRQKGKFNT